MDKTKRIKASELPGMIQERLESHYFLYEIEDIIKGLSEVLKDCLIEGYEVKLKGVGCFRPKPSVEREFKSGLTGETFIKNTKSSVTFRPEAGFVSSLNKVVDN